MSTTTQQDKGFMTYPTTDWHRWLFKAPRVLWRLGLGPVAGQVFLLITHTGRKSGLPRRTMTEYHVINGRKYAPCAFGERAQWYKNIQADPFVTLQSADGVEAMQARRVTADDELLAFYHVIMERNPVMMQWLLDALEIDNTPDDLLAKKDRVYIITFDPTDSPTPPPQPADLTWVWGVVIAVLALLVLLLRPRKQASSRQ
jgi:deazaflavin-dependent oxidoreductase (nitroreductase family)